MSIEIMNISAVINRKVNNGSSKRASFLRKKRNLQANHIGKYPNVFTIEIPTGFKGKARKEE